MFHSFGILANSLLLAWLLYSPKRPFASMCLTPGIMDKGRAYEKSSTIHRAKRVLCFAPIDGNHPDRTCAMIFATAHVKPKAALRY